MPFFKNASRFIINGDEELSPNTHQLLSHAVEVVQQAVAAGNTSGACLWGIRSMSEEEQRCLQEELARSDKQLMACGALPNLSPGGEHSRPQGPSQANLSPPEPILSYVSIANELQLTMPWPTHSKRPTPSTKSKRRFSFKSLFRRFRHDPANC